jgi:hypothetical protein
MRLERVLPVLLRLPEGELDALMFDFGHGAR